MADETINKCEGVTLDSFRLRLQSIRAVVSIASSVAIPVVLALVGYAVQERLADDGLRKDYVSFAVGILKDNPDGQDPSLRGWATTVLTTYSPIKFSDEAKKSLETVRFVSAAIPSLPIQARQLQASDTCLPSCSRALIEEREKWKKELSVSEAPNTSAVDAVRILAGVLKRADQRAEDLAATADQRGARGVTCEQAYDAVAGGP